PPPVNPKLQRCIEQYVFNEYAVRESDIRAAIERARALDLGALPKKMRSEISESLDDAEKTFALRQKIAETEAALDA
ncbi:MAG: hypothetical protein GWN87_13200, partial [Desulfuromonadales bacterium]|nr:hypothetical protein [Desulfuromonadales bacterium]